MIDSIASPEIVPEGDFTIPDEITLPVPETTEDKVQIVAQEALDFIEEQCKDHLGTRFWEIIRDFSIGKVGLPDKSTADMKPMEEKEVKIFMEVLMPSGKYAGQKVKTVLKKDKDYLRLFSEQPSMFQKRIKKFLLHLEQKK